MVKTKRRLYEFKHPFNDYPFEAMCCGSWQAVEKIRISNGSVTLHLVNDQFMILERGPYSDFRVRSRQATSSDCTCFLRPGVDVCILSSSHSTGNLDVQGSEPVWIDAKISSIERRPHDAGCSCQFYVQLYADQKPLGSEKGSLCKEIIEMGIDQISILQRVRKNFCEGQHYRWDFSEDCSLLPKTKLLLGKFLSDLSWLVVTSALKHVTFDVRSLDNKILYQILESNQKSTSGASDKIIYAVNFRDDDGMFIPIIHQLDSSDKIEMPPAEDAFDNQLHSFTDLMDLRRSKRRNVQPDRFLGCDNIDESEIDYSGTRVYKTEPLNDDEMTLPLACLFGTPAGSSKVKIENESNNNSNKLSVRDDLSVFKSRIKSLEMKSGMSDDVEDKNELAIVPLLDEQPIASDPYPDSANGSGNYTKQITEMSATYYYINNKRKIRKRKFSDYEDVDFENDSCRVKASSSKGRRTSYHSISYKEDGHPKERPWQKRSLSAGAYKDLINSFLKNIDSTIKKEEPQIIDQWKEFKNKSCLDKRIAMEMPSNQNEEESSEIEMLWREMEISLASSYLIEANQGLSNGTSLEPEQKASKWCRHEFKLNEEIGMLCHICGFVSTEIKDVSAPFMQHMSWSTEERRTEEKDSEHNTDEEEEMNIFSGLPSSDDTLSEENDNVWALIPEFRNKLHLHQKKAFEFLWKNVAGSMVPALMDQASRKIGGCVISHTPGAGKTFLIISFLVSYLKLFPGKRPLVLAPKTTLYTWYKEFIKWEVPVPIHLIHGRRTYRVFRANSKPVTFAGPRPTDDVMHILDCLEKIKKWHAHPSVLVMGYTSFLTLMREDAKFAHRKYMAKVLRQSPGILILDEGHNPRSTKSRLRKVLMKVETDLRILLSGTLFQNNFCEYFNTLCLARPKFVNEVLKKLDPKFKRKKRKAPHLQEARARKFFLDKIARKIDAGDEEDRRDGLNMLRNMTGGFIDVYEGGSKDGLPGLQIYTLLMNTTDIQQQILNKLHKIMAQFPGYPLELELLITLGSIHPWLVKTAVCASKFFSDRELMELDRYKFDLRKGSKVMFVLNLVYRVVKKEKILIFCHNIAPVKLFIELFENVFRWKRGREILALTGDLELFERGKVMDKFEDPVGPSKVLLASITACAEGISLTAASRVILLDSEWNPSKTKQAIARAFRPGQLKVVYVYQLLVTGTLEEDKYKRTTWKEWVSSMIFSEAFVEDPSKWQAEKIEDEVLREMVEEDRVKSFHMIMKNEKASTVIREKD